MTQDIKERDAINSFLKADESMWVSVKRELPKLDRNYWVSDGDKLALGCWNIEDMCWKFLWMNDCFEVKWMMEINLPKPPANHQPRE